MDIRPILLAFFVAGCATVPTMKPYAPHVYDAKRWQADQDYCRTVALEYHNGLSPGTIIQKSAEGAAQNLPGAAAQVYVPVLGAAGAGTGELFEELGITDLKQQQVFVKCLDWFTSRDGSAVELEPPP